MTYRHISYILSTTNFKTGEKMNKYVKERQDFERSQIKNALIETDLNVFQAAKELQWSRGNLLQKIKKYWGRNYRMKIIQELQNND